MYLRRCYRNKDGKRHGYWALVESYRSSRVPRQRAVAYLGEMDAAGRLGIHQQAAGSVAVAQRRLFRDIEPQWVEVDLKQIAIERKRAFGGPWIGLELCRQVGLVDFLEQTLPTGREEIPWPVMAQILILARLLRSGRRGFAFSINAEMKYRECRWPPAPVPRSSAG